MKIVKVITFCDSNGVQHDIWISFSQGAAHHGREVFIVGSAHNGVVVVIEFDHHFLRVFHHEVQVALSLHRNQLLVRQIIVPGVGDNVEFDHVHSHTGQIQGVEARLSAAGVKCGGCYADKRRSVVQFRHS